MLRSSRLCKRHRSDEEHRCGYGGGTQDEGGGGVVVSAESARHHAHLSILSGLLHAFFCLVFRLLALLGHFSELLEPSCKSGRLGGFLLFGSSIFGRKVDAHAAFSALLLSGLALIRRIYRQLLVFFLRNKLAVLWDVFRVHTV